MVGDKKYVERSLYSIKKTISFIIRHFCYTTSPLPHTHGHQQLDGGNATLKILLESVK